MSEKLLEALFLIEAPRGIRDPLPNLNEKKYKPNNSVSRVKSDFPSRESQSSEMV